MGGNTDELEEWKVARQTIMEFDQILSKIRSLDITATAALLAGGFNYSNQLFLVAIAFNIAVFGLEIHYHKYLFVTANYAIKLEDKLGYNITKNLANTKNKYKDGTFLHYLCGCLFSRVYYAIYLALIIISLWLYYCN